MDVLWFSCFHYTILLSLGKGFTSFSSLSLSNLYLFFSRKPQKRYSLALNYSEVFQRLGESTPRVVSGWLLSTSITSYQEPPQIQNLSQLPSLA